MRDRTVGGASVAALLVAGLMTGVSVAATGSGLTGDRFRLDTPGPDDGCRAGTGP